MKKQISSKPQIFFHATLCIGIALFSINGKVNAQDGTTQNLASTTSDYSFADTIVQSVTGDVYSETAGWQDLKYSNLFNEGWNKPWASPPNGSGGAPRQGWLNAYDGVFYRLGIAVFGWQHGIADGYTGNLVNYTPLSQRLEIQTDIPMVSNGGGSGRDSQTNFGDFRITPRVILSESKDVTQSFNLTFRTPTGNSFNGNNVASITPQYQFWANSWKGLVVRGGAGFTIPYSGDITRSGARTTFDANLAIGYYMTPHDFTPFGDMVWYLSTNVSQPIDNRAKNSETFVSLTPGFRTHLGQNWYLLGAVEVPVTDPKPYDYQVLSGIMKVF